MQTFKSVVQKLSKSSDKGVQEMLARKRVPVAVWARLLLPYVASCEHFDLRSVGSGRSNSEALLLMTSSGFSSVVKCGPKSEIQSEVDALRSSFVEEFPTAYRQELIGKPSYLRHTNGKRRRWYGLFRSRFAGDCDSVRTLRSCLVDKEQYSTQDIRDLIRDLHAPMRKWHRRLAIPGLPFRHFPWEHQNLRSIAKSLEVLRSDPLNAHWEKRLIEVVHRTDSWGHLLPQLQRSTSRTHGDINFDNVLVGIALSRNHLHPYLIDFRFADPKKYPWALDWSRMERDILFYLLRSLMPNVEEYGALLHELDNGLSTLEKIKGIEDRNPNDPIAKCLTVVDEVRRIFRQEKSETTDITIEYLYTLLCWKLSYFDSKEFESDQAASGHMVRSAITTCSELELYLKRQNDPRELRNLPSASFSAHPESQNAPSDKSLVLPSPAVHYEHLPEVPYQIFGRKGWIKSLNRALDDKNLRVLAIIGSPGAGKTNLVCHWLQDICQARHAMAENGFGWSFDAQAITSEDEAPGDLFLPAALKRYGEKAIHSGYAGNAAERLAGYIHRSKGLLVLDGFEKLMEPPDLNGVSRIGDRGMQSLIRSLCYENDGLAIITSRIPIADLKGFPRSAVRQVTLENFTRHAARQYLKNLGVHGSDKELDTAAKEYQNHALALTLFGNYIRLAFGGDVTKRGEIHFTSLDGEQRNHELLTCYDQWFRTKREAEILRVLSLFESPVTLDLFLEFCSGPRIRHLTDQLSQSKAIDIRRSLAVLQELNLIAPIVTGGRLGYHPILKLHYRRQLQNDDSSAWKKGNARLFKYFRSMRIQEPLTPETVSPWLTAVVHGCSAGLYDKAFEEVYLKLVHRGDFRGPDYGGYASMLSTLRHFYRDPWKTLHEGISPSVGGTILNNTGYNLFNVGRLDELAVPLKHALKLRLSNNDPKNASSARGNLSELHLNLGNLTQAVRDARAGLSLALISKDKQRIWREKTTLGDALHRIGKYKAALRTFEDAEERYQVVFGKEQRLGSFWGYRYDDLLLTLDQTDLVVQRATSILQKANAVGNEYDALLANLTLLKAALQRSSMSETLGPLADKVVDGFRLRSNLIYMPVALMARANLGRLQGSFHKAGNDLNEALHISETNQMVLRSWECSIEKIALNITQGELAQAHKDARNLLPVLRDYVPLKVRCQALMELSEAS